MFDVFQKQTKSQGCYIHTHKQTHSTRVNLKGENLDLRLGPEHVEHKP